MMKVVLSILNIVLKMIDSALSGGLYPPAPGPTVRFVYFN